MNNTHNVFVYGTLQKGCSNHYLLAGAAFLGPALTEENFVMRTLVSENGYRGIPFVGRDLDLGPVHGEVYAVDDQTLATLDRLEGCVMGDTDASWYRREAVPVRVGGADTGAPGSAGAGREETAWIYLHERPASPLVASGRWKDAAPMVDPCYYFAYGSNMDPAQMVERGVPFDQCRPACLQHHVLAFNKAGLRGTEAYANAMPERGQDLPGLLYRVPRAELENALDLYEGVRGGHYRRVVKEVLVGDVRALPTHREQAWVYLAGADHLRDGLPVSDRYMARIRRGHALLGLADDSSGGLSGGVGQCA